MTRCAYAMLACLLLLSAVSCDQRQATAPPKAGSIIFIAKNNGNPYFLSLAAGFRKAAIEFNGDFDMVAPDSTDVASQVPLIEDAVSKGVNVIAIAPNSADAVAPALKAAIGKGVAVITVDSDTTGHPDARSVAVLGSDPKVVGESEVEMMSSLLYGSGEFAILSSTPDAPNQKAWIDAMKAVLASNPEYKNLTLVDTVYGNDNPDKSYAACKALIDAHPNLRGIISPTTVGIVAAARCLDATGKYPQIKLTGLGTPIDMRPFLHTGIVRSFELWDPNLEGYMAGYIGYQIANGTYKPAPNSTVQCGLLGKRTLDSNGVVTGDDPVKFNYTNVDNNRYNF
jgi:rhamnose transport system substrate-binding protein